MLYICKHSTVSCKHSVLTILLVLHITQSQMDLQKSMYRLSSACLTKPKKKGKICYKCLMIYCNTLLTGSLQSPMQILQVRSARSDLSMCNAARKQLGIQPEVYLGMLTSMKCYLHIIYMWDKGVVYWDSVTKQWHWVVITS